MPLHATPPTTSACWLISKPTIPLATSSSSPTTSPAITVPRPAPGWLSIHVSTTSSSQKERGTVERGPEGWWRLFRRDAASWSEFRHCHPIIATTDVSFVIAFKERSSRAPVEQCITSKPESTRRRQMRAFHVALSRLRRNLAYPPRSAIQASIAVHPGAILHRSPDSMHQR